MKLTMSKLEKVTKKPTFALSTEKCPVSYSRQSAHYLDEYLDSPGLARANIAVSTQNPEGTASQVEKFGEYVGVFLIGNGRQADLTGIDGFTATCTLLG
jgi:hypothetical protein